MIRSVPKQETSFSRRSFIGGSDARIIMGDDESRPAAPLAGEARRGRAGRPLRQPHRPAWGRDRAPQSALVRAKHRPGHQGRPAAGAPPGGQVDGGNARRGGRGNRRRLRGQVHAAVVVLRGRRGRKIHAAASAQHVGDERHDRGALDHHGRRQMGRDHASRPIRSTSTSCSRPRRSSGAALRAASLLVCSASSRRGHASRPFGSST